jgi:trans-aconitate 2-methyltransferase
MNPWDPNKYLQFGGERTRPAVDLATRIAIADPKTIIDLGCGPGNSTQVLRQRWPAARVSGLDSSAEMIAAARAAFPDQEWRCGRIEDWSADEPYDVVFSNATLQWVKDHVALTKRLFEQVVPGGVLAFQIPAGAYSPVRTFIFEISTDKAWTHRMDEARSALTMEVPHVYYDALAPRATSMDIWETRRLSNGSRARACARFSMRSGRTRIGSGSWRC